MGKLMYAGGGGSANYVGLIGGGKLDGVTEKALVAAGYAGRSSSTRGRMEAAVEQQMSQVAESLAQSLAPSLGLDSVFHRR